MGELQLCISSEYYVLLSSQMDYGCTDATTFVNCPITKLSLYDPGRRDCIFSFGKIHQIYICERFDLKFNEMLKCLSLLSNVIFLHNIYLTSLCFKPIKDFAFDLREKRTFPIIVYTYRYHN